MMSAFLDDQPLGVSRVPERVSGVPEPSKSNSQRLSKNLVQM